MFVNDLDEAGSASLVGHIRESSRINRRLEKIGGPLNVSGGWTINGFAYRYFVQSIGETATIEVVLQTTCTGSIQFPNSVSHDHTLRLEP